MRQIPAGTRVYDTDTAVIGTVLRPSRTFAGWVWVAWPGCTEMVSGSSLTVA